MVAVRLAAAGVICIAFGNFHLFGGGGGGVVDGGKGALPSNCVLCHR